MEERIVLRFNRHALHQHQAGSWFLPQSPRVRGHNLFIYDKSISSLMDRVHLSTAKVTNVYDGNYALPVIELNKAARARTDWLNHHFVTVANKIHREARSCPLDEYRYNSLHPGQDEWLARYVQASTGSHFDLSLEDLNRLIGRPFSSFHDLHDAPLIKPDIQELHLLKGIRELKAIGPSFRQKEPISGVSLNLRYGVSLGN